MTRVINWAHEAASLLVIRIIRHEDKFITSNLQAAHLGGVGGQVWWFSSNNMFVFSNSGVKKNLQGGGTITARN